MFFAQNREEYDDNRRNTRNNREQRDEKSLICKAIINPVTRKSHRDTAAYTVKEHRRHNGF